MEGNIYAPPGAPVQVADDDKPAALYVVSKTKFLLLFFLTLGVYELYWFYRNWKQHKLATGASVLPVMRGLFFIFFVHALFRVVQEKLVQAGKAFSWKPRAHAWWVVLLALANAAADRLARNAVGSPYPELVSFALLVPTALVLAKAQEAINLSCDDPAGAANGRLTVANYLWMALGALLWLAALAGLLLPAS
jgi:hypothetical protein